MHYASPWYRTARIAGIAVMALAALAEFTAAAPAETAPIDCDVCVYGATPSGILAAVAVAREGHAAVIVEPGRWVGGILGAGLKPTQDCPNIHATGGLTRELLETLGQPVIEVDGRKTHGHVGIRELNPRDIRRDFGELLDQYGVRVFHNHRVASCEKEAAAVQAATFDLAPFDDWGCPVAEPREQAALRITATIFIDASYEGDLMARAGVAYRVGRESAEEYGEERAGVQPPSEAVPLDPFVEPGDPASGLLRWVQADHGRPVGAADEYTQAYNYRYYTTDDPEYRIPFTPPADYDPRDFELVGRYVAHLAQTVQDPARRHDRLARIFPGWNNSGVWNYHRDSLFSMAPVGVSQLYADGDYATKARVWKLHQDYLRGLHRFMSTDPRVPAAFRERTAAIGLDGRHHRETQGWPHQLYIRVSRRMCGRAVITADDVYNRTTVSDPIGLAQYGIDTYPSRRIWFRKDGQAYVGLEGEMFIGSARGPTNVPYPLPYRAITPRSDECTNLLVPVCFSASHLGYASARMEPVFMICGESAGIAACRAIAEDTTVQAIDPAAYRAALDEAGQVLVWNEELAELAAAGSAPRAYTFDHLRAVCDRDGDGRVSRSEWAAGKSGWEWLFPRIDRDSNGTIDAEEYGAFQEYKRTHPDWQQLRPQTPP